ncbi:MAG: helix-turn-helix protein [Mucilaginibacter sp.]|nr:helix-turn-helix protein [Mucilaginibacter sp.]
MSETGKLVSAKIKEKRIELGVTQYELGIILGCTQQMIQNYEAAYCEMPVQMLNDLAKLCKVPLDFFFLKDNELLVYVNFL